ncbi:carboxylesterase/lipase family protein [Variovorax sp. tm]|uniref:carboxylesterase/lipase family protein n=1 Tax=Variovorax atrisoli TaxID=3394203 RepID=UPI003A811204
MNSARRPPEVTLPHGGRLRGTWSGDVRVFRGVRYARAPIGELRFEAPVAEPPWRGLRQATAFGPAFLQWPRDADAASGPLGSEDALSLNIWASEVPPGAHLPVMVWVHGGGYFRGAASNPLYDGASFARQGLVFVSIQYRLGVDGFAHLPPAPANRGLLDQLAALHWVQDFICSWGGDPGQVTVFGQSAGAGALVCLMGMPASHGLFHRAILQSPSIACQDIDEATAACKAIAALAGIAPTREAMAAAPNGSLLQAVHRLASDARLRKAHGLNSRNFFPLRPVIDGQWLQAPPLDALAREWQAHRTSLQILVGHNAEEMRLYHVPDGALERLTQADLEDFVRDAGLAMPGGTESPAAQLCALQSRYYYGDPARRLAELATAHRGSTHRYLFAWRSPQYRGQLGAAHGVELPFVFEGLQTAMGREFTGNAAPRELAHQMHKAWGRFAREGNPGWPAHTSERPWLQIFDSPSGNVTPPPQGQKSLMSI